MLELMLLIAGVLCMLLSLLLMVRPYVPAAIASYIALCLLHWSYYISVTESTFIFWGIATLLLMTIARMQPREDVKKSQSSNIYITVGALAGMLLGMTVSASILVLGVAVGAVLGLMAFVNTPKCKALGFSPSTFIHYFCAKGLPIVVAMAMNGIVLEGFLIN